MDILKGLDYHCPPGNDPKYRRLGSALLACLRANNVPPGSKLPNDKELARRFHTAVMTMAHALNDLAAKGILERRVGAGTFVLSLNPNSSNTWRRIGIICHENITMEGGFVTSLMLELYRQAQEYGFDLIQLQRSPHEYLETLKSFGLHGMIVLSAEPEFMPEIAALAAKGINVIQLGVYHREYADFSFGTDHRETTRQAVKYLAGMGHRKIGVFNTPIADNREHHSSITRINAWQEICREMELPVDPDWMIKGDSSGNNVEEKLRELQKNGNLPSAFLLLRLPLAIKVYNILNRLDLRIPEDISLLAFDDSFITEQLTPGLNSFSQNIPELVSRTLNKLNRPEQISANGKIPSLLIEKGSCAKLV